MERAYDKISISGTITTNVKSLKMESLFYVLMKASEKYKIWSLVSWSLKY